MMRVPVSFQRFTLHYVDFFTVRLPCFRMLAHTRSACMHPKHRHSSVLQGLFASSMRREHNEFKKCFFFRDQKCAVSMET